MNRMQSSRRGASGFSLVEAMVGLVLTGFLIIGMVQVFSASRTAYQASAGVSRTQEGSRFAIDFLARDIRMAGHMGCANDMAHFPQTAPADPEFYNHFGAGTSAPYGLRFDVPIQGYEANTSAPGNTVNLAAPAAGWAPALNAGIAALSPVPVRGSDVLVLRFFGTDSAPMITMNSTVVPATMSVPASMAPFIRTNDAPVYGLYGVANCKTASVFRATSNANAAGQFQIATTGINAVGFIEPAYAPNAANIFPAQSMVYYVGMGPGGVPSLYRSRFNGAAWTASEELVEGVEMMQLTYGRDTNATAPDGGIDNYATASGIAAADPTADATASANWRRVGAVRMSLLLRSTERAGTRDLVAGSQLRVGGVIVTPVAGSGLLRVPYDTTIAIRNRLFGN